MNSKILNERGQALILIALAAIGIFGVVGLAIDGGAKFADQRAAQNAADTAALAAAFAKVDALLDGDSNTPAECPPASGTPSTVCAELLAAGFARATSNGYDGNLVTNTVEIYSPPIDGPYAGIGNYVQVVITSHVNTTFARVIGIDQTHNVVRAEAFIRDGGFLADGAMIISYDPDPGCSSGTGSGGGSIDVSGNATVNLTGGGIFMNSDEVCGFAIPNCANLNISGGAGINSVASVDNIDQDGCSSAVPENFNQDPVIIPEDVYWPDVPPECSMSGHPTPTKLGEITPPGSPQPVDEWLIYPGYYEDFPNSTLVTNKAQIYLASGVYCIDVDGPTKDSNLSWSVVAASLLNGSTESSPGKSNYNKYHAYNPDGVTLYIRGGDSFSINASSPTYLTGSTAGDYQGYLFIVEGTHTDIKSCNITGGADIDIYGMIFAPYCNITVNGQSGTTAEINAQLIGWDLKINGTNSINFNYDPSNQVVIKSQIGLMR